MDLGLIYYRSMVRLGKKNLRENRMRIVNFYLISFIRINKLGNQSIDIEEKFIRFIFVL